MHERQSVKRLIILNLCERLRTVADAKSCPLKAETGVRFPLGSAKLADCDRFCDLLRPYDDCSNQSDGP